MQTKMKNMLPTRNAININGQRSARKTTEKKIGRLGYATQYRRGMKSFRKKKGKESLYKEVIKQAVWSKGN